ncbi:MAG: EAL domain-containing protein [Pseudomonadota bacterium]|nr:EAL domain-containing protein [Pseudomonadota bacterium]
MSKISLSSKITASFVFISVLTLGSLYVHFQQLFEDHMLKVESEKSQLISETIAPMMAMNFYLGIEDEVKALAEQTVSRDHVAGLRVIHEGTVFWLKVYDPKSSPIITNTPVLDPVTGMEVGQIELAYKKDAFYQARDEMQQQITYYLGGLGVLFVAFAFLMRYLLRPLTEIANRISHYVLGEKISFSDIRMEPETATISDAFLKMVVNLREYTVLLEQYKHSVDESAIVTKIDLDGHLTYVNDEYKRLMDLQTGDVVGSESVLLDHPNKEEEFYEEVWKTLKYKNIWKGVLNHKTTSGKDVYAKSTIVPMLDENRQVVEYISIEQDITQIIEQQEQINRQTTDPITGLSNRTKLEEDMHSLVGPKLAILSIDNHRVIKDYYGYRAAEITLKEVSRILLDNLQSLDAYLYKLSDGEFAILMDEGCSISQFKLQCEVLIKSLENIQIESDDDRIDLHVSSGLTANKPNLLAYAALALQHAQDLGKITVLYEDEENLAAQYKNNLTWTKKIKQALAEDRIALFAQPIVNSETLVFEKYECLVRLIERDGKVVSPFFFLDIAKKTKLYHQITQRVIQLALETFSKLPDVEFSINLSPVDLLHSETVEFLKSQIERYGVASRLVLEIIESEEIENFDSVTQFIAELKALGCKVAIDDFGTGYSNFSYLMQLNVDYIKVDGSLIRDIDQDDHAAIISSTIISFAQALDIKTVAEFVHSESVQQKVTELGFDYLQGFHLGEPVPSNSLLENHPS